MAGAFALGIVGVFPTQRLAGREGLLAMGVGIGISCLASIGAAIPLAFNRDMSPASRQIATLGAMAIRMFVTLVLFATCALCAWVPNKPLAIWTGMSYLILLAIETTMAVQLLKRREHVSP